jgi:septation ring formation regulator EzrA
LSKEIEKLKFELSDVIDQKFDFIQKGIDTQSKNLTTSFDEISRNLGALEKDLLGNYRENFTKIKGMVATFFAKIDDTVKSNSKTVKHVTNQFEQFQANFVNPAKEVEGKVFAMNMKIASSEQMRESQFTVLKDTV